MTIKKVLFWLAAAATWGVLMFVLDQSFRGAHSMPTLVSAGGNSSVSLSNVHVYPDADVYDGKIYECVDKDGEVYRSIDRPDRAMAMGMDCYDPRSHEDATRGIRNQAIQVNAELARILPNPRLIDVGAVPNDGTGDPLPIALAKIRDDLRRIPEVRR